MLPRIAMTQRRAMRWKGRVGMFQRDMGGEHSESNANVSKNFT
jgi:hypothetical protein